MSSFPWFSPVFMSVYIYLESHHTALSEVCKVRSISAYRWNLTFFVARHMIMRNSPPQGKETSLNIFGKEVDLARNPFHKQRIYHQKSINVQQSFRLGRRATLYYEGLISLACVSSETQNLQRVFRPGGIPVVLSWDSCGTQGWPFQQGCAFRAEKRSAQASAHPLSQAQGGLFLCVDWVCLLFVAGVEWNARGANVCSL